MAIKKTEAGTYVCDHMWRRDDGSRNGSAGRTISRELNANERQLAQIRSTSGQRFTSPPAATSRWHSGQWW